MTSDVTGAATTTGSGLARRAVWALVSRVAVAITVLAGAASTASAHEIGKTQVVAIVNAEGTYQIDVAVDPDALLMQLQLARDGRVDIPSARAARDRALAEYAPQFVAGVHLVFDETTIDPVFEYRPPSLVGDAVQSAGLVRLTGRVPSGAQRLTLQYDFAGGTFAVVARILGRPARTMWVEPRRPSEPIALVALAPLPSTSDVAIEYFGLGFTHILPHGLDHILFVLGLFLLSTHWRPVLAQISAFTIAHSITLGLTAYGIVALPARVVEPLIAVSIAYVAIENLLTERLQSWRIALVFAFGLLHGMGFASVLRDLGLPRHEFLTALLTFNLGVEAGQLSVVGLAAVAVARWRSSPTQYRTWIVRPASVAIGIAAMFWVVQRIM